MNAGKYACIEPDALALALPHAHVVLQLLDVGTELIRRLIQVCVLRRQPVQPCQLSSALINR